MHTRAAPEVTAIFPFATNEPGTGVGLAAFVRMLADAAGSRTAFAQAFRQAQSGAMESQELELDTVTLGAMIAAGDLPSVMTHVLTGRVDPPRAEPGYLRLALLEVASGTRIATAESPFDDHDAGAVVARALGDMARGRSADGGLRFAVATTGGALEGLAPLAWTSLGELASAERCLVTPVAASAGEDRAPDVTAALMHMERAIASAAEAASASEPAPVLPARRLAALIRVVELEPRAPKWLDAAARSVQRARTDAPADPDLREAAVQLALARGDLPVARAVLDSAPVDATRAWESVLRARAANAAHEYAAALAILDEALTHEPTSPLLLTERGITMIAAHRAAEGVAVLERVLGAFPCFPAAFTALARVAREARDAATTARLLDMALAALVPGAGFGATPPVLDAALSSLRALEPPGVARGSRALRLLEAMHNGPHDPIEWRVHAAEAHAECGDTKRAERLFDEARARCRNAGELEAVIRARLGTLAPSMLLAAEAVTRAATTGDHTDLPAVLERAARLGRETEYAPFFQAAAAAAERLGDASRAKDFAKMAKGLHART